MFGAVLGSTIKVAATEAVHEMIQGALDAKKGGNLPSPVVVVSNPLTMTTQNWKQIEAKAQEQTRPMLLALKEQCNQILDRPSSPFKLDDEVPEKSKSLWEKVKEFCKDVKANGLASFILQEVKSEMKGLEDARTKMNDTRAKLRTMDNKDDLAHAADDGVALTYKMVAFTNNLTMIVEAFQKDADAGGEKLKGCLPAGEDFTQRGIYKLIQKGIKAADALLANNAGDLQVFATALSNRVQQLTKPIPLAGNPSALNASSKSEAKAGVVPDVVPALTATALTK